jgi:hypothetical protein
MKTKTKLLSVILGVALTTCLNSQTVTGNGTYQYLPRWNSNPTGSTVTNSIIFDNGTNVGISTSSPSYKLDVNGSLNILNTGAFYLGGTKFASIGGASGSTCTFLGLNAGANGTASSSGCNTMIGYESGYLNNQTTYYKNTFVGYQSGYNNAAPENAFFGYWSGTNNTSGDENVFMGSCSGRDNTVGDDNTFIGHWACSYNQGGADNTAIGAYAMGELGHSATYYGNYNTALGSYALLYNNATAAGNGSNNTVVGYNALYGVSGHNNNANNNCVFGFEALKINTTAGDNVVMGANALHSQTYDNGGTAWSSYNVAIGGNALYTNNPTSTSNGYRNTAVGYAAGYANTTGSLNCFFGFDAGYATTSGQKNNFEGYQAGYSNTTGNYNSYTGYTAGYYGTTGTYNTAFGYAAGLGTTTGSNNTTIGANAGGANTTGTYNSYVGYNADANANNYTNSTAVGYNSLNTGSNDIVLGNASITSLRCQVGLTGLSDRRVKDNIQSNVPGLSFINLLHPVTYHFNVDHENQILGIDAASDSAGNTISNSADEKYNIQQIQYSGFIAQSVDSAAQQAGYDFSGVYRPSDPSKDLYGLRYTDFIPSMVKAIQELSKEVDSLNHVVAHQNGLRTGDFSNDSANAQEVTLTSRKAILYQNEPNPAGDQTKIRYYISEESSHAEMVFFDMYGKEIKRVVLENKGNAEVDVNTKDLDAGAYSYSLIVDGNIIETKTLVRSH